MSRKLKILDFFKSVDLFGDPITLHLYGKKRFQTTIGSILSLIMLGLVLTFSNYKLRAIMQRTGVSIESKEEMQFFPEKLNFKNRFALQITASPIYNLTSISGKRYFDYYGVLGSYTQLHNGTYAKEKKYFKLVPCQQKHFPMFSYDELFKEGIVNWLCFNTSENDDLFTWGKYGNEHYQYIQISVTKCTSRLNQNAQDYCANETEMKNIFQDKIYTSIYFVNSLIDLSNFYNPITPYFDVINYMLDYDGLYNQKEAYFTPIHVETDETWLFNFNFGDQNPTMRYNFDFLYERQIDEFSTTSTQYYQNIPLYTSFYFRSGSMKKIYSRNYVVVQDYMECFGSFLSIFLAIFKILNDALNHKTMSTQIANSLSRVKKITAGEIDFGWKNLMPFITKKFTKKIGIKNDLKDSVLKLPEINKKLRKKMLASKLIDTAIRRDTDLIEILKSIQQFESMKELILTPEQRSLLQFTRKPKISQKDSQRILPSGEEAYQVVSKGQTETELNRKILNILDPEFIKKVKQSDGSGFKKVWFPKNH